MPKSPARTITNYRNAITGQFVKPSYVKTHKSTTTTEHNPRPAPAKPPKKS
jgi:hypothetical protein